MANRNIGTLTIDLLARTGGFEQGMDRAERTARNKSKAIERQAQTSALKVQQVWGVAAAAVGGALAGISVGAVFSSFIQNTIAAQNEQAQLAAVLRSTGQAAGYNADQLNEMAGKMEKMSTFSAGEISEAQTTLLAFTGIVGDQFPKALQAAADMAARTGMTVKSAAETIGRSLDVPSQGLAALSRQGFRFTKEQKELAEQLEATGRVSEAQAIVLQALEESYGGAAEAARDTLGGAMVALRNALSALLTGNDDGIQGLVDIINRLSDALGSDKARRGLEALVKAIEVAAVVFAARLAVPVVAAGTALVGFTAKVGLAAVGVGGLSAALEVSAARMAVASAVARTTATGLALMGGPIGAIVLALGGAAYAWSQLSSTARDAAGETARATADVKTGVDDLVSSYRKLNELQQQQVVNIKLEDLALAARESQKAVADLGDAFEPALTKGARGAAKFRAEFSADVRGIVSDTEMSAGDMALALSRLIDSYVSSGKASAESKGELVQFAQRVVEASGRVSTLTQELQALAGAQSQAANGFAPVVDNLARFRENYDKFLKEFATPNERFKAAVEEQKKLLGPLFDEKVVARLRNRYLPKRTGDGANLESITRKLREQIATFGMTAEQAERYRIQTGKGTDAQRAHALALFDSYELMRKLGDAQTAYKDLVKSLRTEEEKSSDLLIERLKILDAANVPLAQYEATLKRISDASIAEMPTIKGVTIETSGVSSELGALDGQASKLQEWYDKQLQMLNGFRQARADLSAQWDEQELALNQRFQEGLLKIEESRQALRMASTEAMFGNLSDVSKVFFGEQSGLYKALFAIEKSYALAKVIMNAPKTASDAYAAMAGIPVVGPALGVAAAAAALSFQVAQVAGIRSASLSGMAHDGIDSVPETGTWLLEKGERVVTAQTSAKLDGVLSRIETGGGKGRGGMTVNLIEDRSRAGQVEQAGDDQREIINIFVADIRGGGRSAQALELTYGLGRRGT